MRCLLPLLLLLPCCLPFLASAQELQGQARVDSLTAALPRLADDTNKVLLLNELAFEYRNINPAKGVETAKEEAALAARLGWKPGQGKAFSDFGNNYLQLGQYPEALNAFLNALRIFEELDKQQAIAITYGNIGIVYDAQKKYSQALDYYGRAYKLAAARNNRGGMMLALGNIGGVYGELGQTTEALRNMRAALDMALADNDAPTVVQQLGNIGGTYMQARQYAQALVYHRRALRMARDIGDKQSEAVNLGNTGAVYLALAQDSSHVPADSLVTSGRPERLRQAADYLQQGIALCREIGLAEQQPQFWNALSQTRALQDDYKGALDAYVQGGAQKDSVFNKENNERITALETARAIELKDKDILIAKLDVARKRNERYAYIGGIVLLLIICGILARSFRKQRHSNALLSKEKARSDALLLNILPQEVAEELKQTGGAQARQYDEVSVMFTDFVQFTQVAETLSPQALVAELDECFTAFDAIIEKHGLEKIKTIGDAYMAVCGLPQSDKRHASRTIEAALEIRDFVGTRLATARSGRDTFQIRIGINSGQVVAGIVGVKKFAYDIWGDTVNTAARMEQHSEPGQVNISHSTYELVKEDFACIPRGKISAKNKGEIEMYFVAGKAR